MIEHLLNIIFDCIFWFDNILRVDYNDWIESWSSVLSNSLIDRKLNVFLQCRHFTYFKCIFETYAQSSESGFKSVAHRHCIFPQWREKLLTFKLRISGPFISSLAGNWDKCSTVTG